VRVTPRRCCLIATTPRSGSWFLAEALDATGLVGEPQEYFGWEVFEHWSEEFGLGIDASQIRFIEEALAYGTTPDGIFSAKMHWSQVTRFVQRVRQQAGDWPRSAGAILKAFFPDLHCVHLSRADTARQAISYWRANQTNQWWDLGEGQSRSELDPDFQQIRWCEEVLTDHERRWRLLLERHQIPTLDVDYEAFVDNREGTVEDVLDLLEIPHLPVSLPAPRLQRQSDARTEEWVVAYRAIRDELAGLPPKWTWSGATIVPIEDAPDPADERRTTRPWRPVPLISSPPGDPFYGPCPELPWPLRYIVDEDGGDTGFVVVRGSLTKEQIELLEGIGRRRRTIGWSSYGTFPRIHEAFDGLENHEEGLHGPERAYLTRCEGWVHCFRHPERFLPQGLPTLLLSESDFVDPDSGPEAVAASNGALAKRFDVLYVCCPNEFNEVTKNWRMARRCLMKLANELQTTAILVGRHKATDVPDVPGITTVDELPWDELMVTMSQSRMLLVPNLLDASPQLIVEAMSFDLPVAVNDQILGGWKYVNRATGRFFHDEHDVVEAVRACLEDDLAPRQWLIEQGGPQRAERHLAAFLRRLPSPPWWTGPEPPPRRAHLAGDIT
jgi:LPS sulfotransferase NodH